jgi:colanic acid biosynthesis glycosyl transferase WcaI
LAAGDIHVVVQKRDAADLMMPSKLANILAAGRVSIATADPGTALHDVVAGHDCGLTVPSEDSTALTEAIKVLAGDAGMRAAFGQRARAYAERYLDKDAILTAFEGDLEKLLSGKDRVSE